MIEITKYERRGINGGREVLSYVYNPDSERIERYLDGQEKPEMSLNVWNIPPSRDKMHPSSIALCSFAETMRAQLTKKVISDE
jgi:hypothetical protein